MDNENLICPVCRGMCLLLDVVDFNKSCEEPRGKFLRLSGIPIFYASCSRCGFCFAPEIMEWPLDEFAARIYNDQYVFVDPDYVEVRPHANAESLQAIFGGVPPSIRHLDYGGGNGTLTAIMRKSGWNSTSYDPFVDRDTRPDQLGQFDLITAFEVFEHVPNVQQLMLDLRAVLSPNGVILFSTLLSDDNIRPNERLSWWYASPRNGHISLFSKNSLAVLARDHGFNFGSFSVGFHTFVTKVPPWAAHFIRTD